MYLPSECAHILLLLVKATCLSTCTCMWFQRHAPGICGASGEGSSPTDCPSVTLVTATASAEVSPTVWRSSAAPPEPSPFLWIHDPARTRYVTTLSLATWLLLLPLYGYFMTVFVMFKYMYKRLMQATLTYPALTSARWRQPARHALVWPTLAGWVTRTHRGFLEAGQQMVVLQLEDVLIFQLVHIQTSLAAHNVLLHLLLVLDESVARRVLRHVDPRKSRFL